MRESCEIEAATSGERVARPESGLCSTDFGADTSAALDRCLVARRRVGRDDHLLSVHNQSEESASHVSVTA